MDKHIQGKKNDLRQLTSYVNLVVYIYKNPVLDALVVFIVICQLLLSLITNALFIEFLQLLYPAISDIIPKASNTICKLIVDSYKKRKEVKIKELKEVRSMIHFSFDLWTSPNHLALLGIVIHYVDNASQNQSVCCFS